MIILYIKTTKTKKKISKGNSGKKRSAEYCERLS